FAVACSNKIFSWGSSPNLLRTAAHSAKRKMKASSEEKKESTTASIDDTVDFLTPKIVDTSLIEGSIVKVVAGSEHNVVLTDTGKLYTWGRNMDGQLGIKTSSITERRTQNILSPTPILFVFWFTSHHGKSFYLLCLVVLGNGPTNRSVSGPAFIETFFNIGVRVFSISCGRNHTLAITDNGVYSWGNNKYGQLGNAHVVQSSYPSLIEALMEYNIIQIVAGQYHSIALDNKERVLTWGWGVHGQLGHGNIEDCFTPKIVASLMNEEIIWCDAGQAHTLFLSKTGCVWACGSNTFGQLGTGRNKKSSVPLKICALTEKIRSISSGYFHN
ncbi:uncharacterized protein, partial [Halyomorpha halys]|uniref:uncharacterized protein n=1 Tax=Halyomorpha halys TaxID=286706 RepID=UPI0034D22555